MCFPNKIIENALLMGGDNANAKVYMKPLPNCHHCQLKFAESLKVSIYFTKEIRFCRNIVFIIIFYCKEYCLPSVRCYIFVK